MPHRLLLRPARHLTALAFVPLIALFLIFTQTTPTMAGGCPTFPHDVPAGNHTDLILAIACANGTPDADVINLAAGSTYTLTVVHSSDTGLPPILSAGGALTINGNGSTITRSSASSFRIFFINSGANLTLNRMIVSGGAGSTGGGILNAGTARLTEVSVQSNTATTGGGGIINSGTLTLHRSAVINNVAGSFGGGIANSSGTLHGINSTISGNSATGTGGTGGGGAIDSYGTSVMSFYNSTITNNTAVAPNTQKSGIWMESGANAGYFNTIIANNNGANNCYFEFNTFWSYFNNIDNGTSCGFTTDSYNNTNPLLAPLGNNGGFTQTHALLPGSPAINLGSNGYAVEEDDVTPLTTDQRGAGFPRIIGSSVDIGAYESFCSGSPYDIGAGDTAALIAAINCANGTPADDVINLAPASAYTLTAVIASGTGLPPITSGSGTLTINGNGSTITRSSAGGTPDFRIFYLNGGSNLTLNRVRLTNGRSSGGSGGSIYNNGGSLTLTESTVDGSTASNGAGIYNNTGGTTILLSSTVSNNVATNYGGGVVNVDATLRVINSTISGNSANGTGVAGGGGALDSFGASADLSIRNSTITNNTAVAPNAARSGVWYEAGGAYIDNNIISGNNGANNCQVDGPSWSPFDSIEDGTSCGFNNNGNPMIGPLADNGGWTQTHALLPGSPAINKGYNDSTQDQFDNPLLYDQRGEGYPRIIDGTVDLGAFENACFVTFPATIAASDTDALIEAITCANLSPLDEVINLTNSTYTLTADVAFEVGLPPIVDAAMAGTLTINGSGATITRSSADGTLEFRHFYVNAGGNLTLNRVTLTNGSVGVSSGGAIVSYGTLTIADSTISGNSAKWAGAISTNFGATTLLTNSLIANNQAERSGGAVDMSSGTLFIINSTISGNSVTGGSPSTGGGALFSTGSSTITIINSTITNNTAPRIERSGIWNTGGTLTIQNSIVANNNGTNNCEGAITDGGNNIDNGTTCGFGANSFSNTDPLIGALANNGSFMQTHALQANSPAINAGNNALAVDQNGAALTTDQRGTGFPRIIGGRVDIGAFERACPSFPYTVPAGQSNQLILAIGCANSTSANNVINLTAGSTYTLTTAYSFEIGLPPIVTAATAGTLTINGNGATITRSSADGIPTFKHFAVETGGNLTLNRVTLTNGRAQVGGAIYSDGTLRLNNSTISENWALAGGALSTAGSATTILMNSLIANNQAERFGGAFDVSSGTTFIINSTISGNEVTGADASYGGGAMDNYNSPTITIINSTITDNTAPQTVRSGIWHESGTLTIRNSIVANNHGANNCLGTINDGGNNIDNGNSCGFGGTVGQFFNPLLAPLANNGGFTLTHALLPGSPAINAGSNALAVDHLGAALTTDQRGTGFPRINNTTVDIGAFESSTNTLDVTVSMQGRSNPKPHPSYVATIRVTIMPAGGGAVFYNQNYVTSQNGTLSIPNLPSGTYLFRFKGTHTLARQIQMTIPASGTVSLETAILLEGDADDNNAVTLPDFSLLAASFGKSLGQVGYDPRADFNGDNSVNLIDFSLLASNFNKAGDGGINP